MLNNLEKKKNDRSISTPFAIFLPVTTMLLPFMAFFNL